MKINRFLLTVLPVFVVALLAHSSAYAKEDEKEKCIDPKFTKFEPPNHAEVAPGSEISFHVRNADKNKISMTAKKIPIAITIEDRNLFLIVKGVLPDSLKGTYARISLEAVAEQGCKSKDGWLLKIADVAAGAEEATEAAASSDVAADVSGAAPQE